MRKLFMLSVAAFMAATGVGCSDDGTEGSGSAVGRNENAISVYVAGTNGDYKPLMCVADAAHSWYQCVVKNGPSLDGGKSFSTYTIGGVWTHTLDWDRNPVAGSVNITFDSYGGDVVGTQADASSPIYFSILPERTLIDENLAWVENSTYTEANDRAPYIWSSQSPETNKGESGYLVGKFWYEDENGGNGGWYRGWIKVTVSEGSVKLGGMCLCLGGGDFRTGDMPVPGANPDPDPEDPKPLAFRLLAPVVGDEINFPAVTANSNEAWFTFNLPFGTGVWGVSGLWGHQSNWADATDTGATYISIENNGGDVVGTQPGGANTPIYYSILPENTVINDDLAWVTNPTYKQGAGSTTWQYVPRVWDSEKPTINKGESGYVVGKFHYRNEAEKIPDGYYRGWVKVDVSSEGAVTVSGMCIAIGEGEFKTGQLPENPYPVPDPVGDYIQVEGWPTNAAYSMRDDEALSFRTYKSAGYGNIGIGVWDCKVDTGAGTGVWIQTWGGDIVGTQEAKNKARYYQIFPKDQEIDENLNWLTWPGWGYDGEGIQSAITTANTQINRGQSGYLVGMFPYENKALSIPYGFHRGWIEVAVAADGSVSFKNACICLNENYVFKTGQTEGTAEREGNILTRETFGTDGWAGMDWAVPQNGWLELKIGGVWRHSKNWADGSAGDFYAITLENYGGKIVGTRADENSPLYYTILDEAAYKGKSFKDAGLTWVSNPTYNGTDYYRVPRLWDSSAAAVNAGKSGYIVGETSKDGTAYRFWAKVTVFKSGVVRVIDMCYCEGSQDFRIGQLPGGAADKSFPAPAFTNMIRPTKLYDQETGNEIAPWPITLKDYTFRNTLVGCDNYGCALFWSSVFDWQQLTSDNYWVNSGQKYVAIDHYGGNFIGDFANGYYDILAKDTPFGDDLSWRRTNGWSPNICGTTATVNDNKSGYIAGDFPYMNLYEGIPYGNYRGWIEVEVGTGGAVTAKDMRLCLDNNMTFKMGQKE